MASRRDVEREPNPGPGGEVGRARAAPGRGGRTRPRATNFTHVEQTQGRGEVRPGNWARRELQQWRKENSKVASPVQPGTRGLAAGGQARSPGPASPRRAPLGVPETPTWQRPGLGQASGSSPTSPPLPLPCPGKGFGERRTGRSYARGCRPSSGRRTSPRRGSRSRAVCEEWARRCPVSEARPGAAGPGEG